MAAARSVWRSLPLGAAIVAGLSQPAYSEAPALETTVKAAIDAGELEGLHALLVMRDGKVLAEMYFPGEDERWGQALGLREHGPDTLHDLRSVTKSVVGLLYGIALADGLVPEIGAGLLDQFPQYDDLSGDPHRSAIQIRHALSMQMGTEWDETLPYSDPRNSEIAMELAEDRYRFVLDRPMTHDPGSRWTYNGGTTAVIAKLIAEGAGKPIDDYAAEVLFAPLGIETYEWVSGPDRVPSAASGLRLTARDLAKIGRMVADGGQWNGTQIVPAAWLEASFEPSASAEDGLRYGFFWWLAPEGSPPHWVAGFGNGGQRLTVGSRTGTVIVVFAGNYNDPQAWRVPVRLITEHVVPALERGAQ